MLIKRDVITWYSGPLQLHPLIFHPQSDERVSVRARQRERRGDAHFKSFTEKKEKSKRKTKQTDKLQRGRMTEKEP